MPSFSLRSQPQSEVKEQIHEDLKLKQKLSKFLPSDENNNNYNHPHHPHQQHHQDLLTSNEIMPPNGYGKLVENPRTTAIVSQQPTTVLQHNLDQPLLSESWPICGICHVLSSQPVRPPKCDHVFCHSCLVSQLDQRPYCPVCVPIKAKKKRRGMRKLLHWLNMPRMLSRKLKKRVKLRPDALKQVQTPSDQPLPPPPFNNLMAKSNEEINQTNFLSSDDPSSIERLNSDHQMIVVDEQMNNLKNTFVQEGIQIRVQEDRLLVQDVEQTKKEEPIVSQAAELEADLIEKRNKIQELSDQVQTMKCERNDRQHHLQQLQNECDQNQQILDLEFKIQHQELVNQVQRNELEQRQQLARRQQNLIQNWIAGQKNQVQTIRKLNSSFTNKNSI